VETLTDPIVEAAIASYFQTITSRDKGAWIALFATSAVVHEPAGTIPGEGREGLEQVWQVFTGPFSRFEIRSDEVFYAASGAATRWTATAAIAGGRSTRFHGITVFELDSDGRIQTVMSYWDPAAVLIHLAGGDDEA
jgi:ketosteroid isomerase-like protein